jgi:hypothetical protein
MVRLLFDIDSKVRENAVDALHCLCDGYSVNQDAIREAGGIAAMNRLLNGEDIEAKGIATETLRYLTK